MRALLAPQTLCLTLAVALAHVVLAPAVSAQKALETGSVSGVPETTTASYGDWLLTCRRDASSDKGATACEVSHAVIMQGQSNPLLQLAVGRTAPNAPLRMTVVLPHHIQFDDQPRISAETGDTTTTQFSWRRCLPLGCFADSDLSSKLQTHLSSAEKGKVSFTDGTGRPVAIPFSLKGFRAALQALEKQ